MDFESILKYLNIKDTLNNVLFKYLISINVFFSDLKFIILRKLEERN
jgi:hypothetical protein